ncbi:MAG TPA: hypothetical protein VLS93_17870 [Anaeromyxobacteraceae bacterium]|nr:hypothetical protein [Anaeromyxobacteraceae bacterium]
MFPRFSKLCTAAAMLALALPARGASRTDAQAAPPASGQPAEPAAAQKERGTRLKIRTPVEVYYTSNLFRIKDRHLNNFDGNLGPGERFDGIDSLGDLVLRPGARLFIDVPIGKKRDAVFGLGADYTLHLQNGIANYPRLAATVETDLTKHDKLDLDVKVVPRRFKKNYHVPFSPDLSFPFEHGYVREIDVAARYDREWTRAVSSWFEFAHERSEFEDPFKNRDSVLNEGRVAIALDVGHKSKIEFGAGFGVSGSPGEVEQTLTYPGGIVVDRSFRRVLVLAHAHFAPAARWDVDAELEIRNRTFTSDVPEDVVHFDRSDMLYRAELNLTRKIAAGLYFEAFGGFTLDRSNRPETDLTPDEAGYKEAVLGVGLQWRTSLGGGR